MEGLDPTSGQLDRLGGDAAMVRRAGFTRLYAAGRPVPVAELAADCGLAEERVEAALLALVGAGVANLDKGGALVATAGLSVVPAKHRLQMAGREFFTWCAFDAVGIPAALGVSGVARTTCGRCGAPIDVATIAGQPPVGGSVVGWLPGGPCDDVQADFCPSANLFCDPGHLTSWRTASGDPPGRSASLSELAVEGRRVWAEMRPAPVNVPPSDPRDDRPGPPTGTG